MAVNGPLSYSLACLGTIITGSGIGAHKYMDIAEALSPNHRHRSAVTRAPLPARRRREARRRRASMLVVNTSVAQHTYICLCPPAL